MKARIQIWTCSAWIMHEGCTAKTEPMPWAVSLARKHGVDGLPADCLACVLTQRRHLP